MTAASPMDGRVASLVMPCVNAEVMTIFLDHVADEFAEDFCLMFLDGAGWHKAKDVRVPDNIKLMPIPPYSPELNPTEHLWEYIRENHFGNDVFDTLEAVEARLAEALNSLAMNPDIVQSTTRFEWLNTLCLT